jgi:hypothetical protein
MISTLAMDSASKLVEVCSIAPMTDDQPSLLFQNKFVRILQVRLKPGQRLNFTDRKLRLVVVGCGRIRLFGPNGSFVLQENGCWRLEPDEHWDVRAQLDSQLILYVVR